MSAIFPSDLDPVCPVCNRDVGVRTWPAPRYVSGFYAALKDHDRIVRDTTAYVHWTDVVSTTATLTREVCPGSGEPPRILPRRTTAAQQRERSEPS